MFDHIFDDKFNDIINDIIEHMFDHSISQSNNQFFISLATVDFIGTILATKFWEQTNTQIRRGKGVYYPI